MNRRSFIIKSFLGFFGIFFLDAFWFERYIIDWNQYDISDKETDSLKIIQLTDLHIDKVRSFHRSIAKRINTEKPDLLLITGDSIDHTYQLPILSDFLDLIDSKIEMIAIMGNKEYSGNVDIDLMNKVFKTHNGKLLINKSLVFKAKNRAINIVGVDDYIGGNADFRKATHNTIDKSLESIVLNHCPVYRDDIERINRSLKVNIKLILSGHTHGGQITLFGLWPFRLRGAGIYLKGWYKNSESVMYVSKGIGTSHFPLRFGARAEAPIFYV